MVVINGESKDLKDMESLNLKEYLEKEGYDIGRVVVEVNLEIIPREQLDKVILKDEDTVEVLRFVGGG